MIFQIIKNLITGFFVGVANIIPGVSGGTFLLIFGIYERTIKAINSLLPTFKNFISSILPKLFSKDYKKSIPLVKKLFRNSDILFLIQIVSGAGVCIIVLSQLMKYLLETHFSPTYGLFFGFILVSVIIPLRLIRKKSIILLLFFIIGAGATVGVTASVNPLNKILGKSKVYKNRIENVNIADKNINSIKKFTFNKIYTPSDYAYAVLCGSVAISAMILPGISGSLVLILMGEYFEVIQAVAGMKTFQLDYFAFLASIMAGMIIGILFFAKIVEYSFSKFYDQTMALLTGLIVGSLYALWPFKEIVYSDVYVKVGGTIQLVQNMAIHTNKNILPNSVGQIFPTLLTCISGIIIMIILLKFEKNDPKI